jgi:hypothetical protein
MNNNGVFASICTFAILGTVFFLVSATIIIALIPVYLSRNLVTKSTATSEKGYINKDS